MHVVKLVNKRKQSTCMPLLNDGAWISSDWWGHFQGGMPRPVVHAPVPWLHPHVKAVPQSETRRNVICKGEILFLLNARGSAYTEYYLSTHAQVESNNNKIITWPRMSCRSPLFNPVTSGNLPLYFLAYVQDCRSRETLIQTPSIPSLTTL